MEATYSRKKNAELEDLLKARSLPHTGKKAELVARLIQYDKEHASKPDSASTATALADDEIDWDDDNTTPAPTSTKQPEVASTSATAAAIAAGETGQVADPAAVPNQVAAIDPSTTSDLKATKETSDTNTNGPPAAPAQDFSSQLPTTTLSDELSKRAARAARFGVKPEAGDEASKALERAKRFGNAAEDDSGAIKGLDSALPDRQERSGRKRGRGGEEGGGGGKRVDSRKRVGTGTKNQNGGQKQHDRGKKEAPKAASGLSEKDRLAAEARKKRFTAA